jgi:hypothetical protein
MADCKSTSKTSGGAATAVESPVSIAMAGRSFEKNAMTYCLLRGQWWIVLNGRINFAKIAQPPLDG